MHATTSTMNAPATGQQWQLRIGFPCLSALPLSRTAQRPVCREAFRQGPEPWDVVEPMQQSTAWQQRQQQQQQRGRQRPIKQRGQRGTTPSQLQQLQQLQAAEASAGRFSSCQTFQALYKALQAQVMPANTQPRQEQRQQQQADAQQGAGNIRADPNVKVSAALVMQQQQEPQQQQQTADDVEAGQVEQPAQMQLLQLSVRDCVGVVNQLGAIARSQHSSSGSSANPFVEDQALQQSLALVYALMEQQQAQPQQPGTSLPAQQLLRCVSTLAGLKYTQPVQLAAWLEAAAADQRAPASRAPQPATDAAAAAAAAAAAGTGSYRQVLAGLRMRGLSTLIVNLAKSGVRPSNVWLLAFMQVAQQKLFTADLPPLAQLLSGLVKVGVKPTTAWLDSMESRAVQCLLEHAVRQQVTCDQQQQEQAQLPQLASINVNKLRQQQQQSVSGGARVQGSNRSPAACQLHHVAQLLTALAEARHTPKPQLSAVLWGATEGSLAAADAASLVELIASLGELQLVPPSVWLQQFFAAAGSTIVLQQCRPWQLASTVAAVGRLAAASRASHSQQQRQQQQLSDVAGCAAWVEASLAAVQQHLPGFAARDLSALLSGLAALQVQVGAAQVQLLLSELQGKLPRLNTAGLADVTEAAVAFSRQWQQQQGQHVLASGFMEALLREVAVKLPVFPAEDLARVLLAVAASDARPSQLWLQASAAQLSSKLTLLQPATLLAVLGALVTLGAQPDRQWLLQASAALDNRLVELSGPQLQQLLALLLSADVAPPVAWLERADWAAQQLAQQQEAGAVGTQQGSCQELLAQLRQLHAQQQVRGAASTGGSIGVEMTG